MTDCVRKGNNQMSIFCFMFQIASHKTTNTKHDICKYWLRDGTNANYMVKSSHERTSYKCECKFFPSTNYLLGHCHRIFIYTCIDWINQWLCRYNYLYCVTSVLYKSDSVKEERNVHGCIAIKYNKIYK